MAGTRKSFILNLISFLQIFTAVFCFLISCNDDIGNGLDNGTSEVPETEENSDVNMDPDLDFSLPQSDNSFTPSDDSIYTAMNALEFSRVMGNGINLGNTLEATGDMLSYSESDVTIYERAWGQPVTTKEMFEAMKAAGFDCVRIPVAWTNTMDWSRGDFIINESFMNRVGQIVNMALDSGLIVMINDHWDRQWWGLFSHNENLAWKIYKSIWMQVGTYFKNYPHTLIFESANEELGHRLNDKIDCEVDKRLNPAVAHYSEEGSFTKEQCYKKILQINQHFVDWIRSTGGKNTDRFLLIAGYDTDIESTCSALYKMPVDSANSGTQKLFISVHYYAPAIYALAGDQNNDWGYSDYWGTEEDVETQNALLYKMKKFTDAGYGVMIGEYGAPKKDDGTSQTNKKDGYENWITNILDNSDTYNYVPFLWDCNTFFKKDGEQLGFFDEVLADVYNGRNYSAELNGTSDGGRITYNGGKEIFCVDFIQMKVDGYDLTCSLTDSAKTQITQGQTLTLKFTRPALGENYKCHCFELYDTSGKKVTGNNWDNACTYPPGDACDITIEWTADKSLNLSKMIIKIFSPDGEGRTPSSLTIRDVILTLK